jgi:uncharacterized protein YehS (DUF1456 family)
MTNNDVLRRLRYAIDLSNKAVIEIFGIFGPAKSLSEVTALLKKENEQGYQECSDLVLEAFLDGLIVYKRGVREGEGSQSKKKVTPLSNNEILRKIRIALELKEQEMLKLFELAQFPASKSELTAIFRAKGNENYKECGDQMLRNFLKGLTLRNRQESAVKKVRGLCAPQ